MLILIRKRSRRLLVRRKRDSAALQLRISRNRDLPDVWQVASGIAPRAVQTPPSSPSWCPSGRRTVGDRGHGKGGGLRLRGDERLYSRPGSSCWPWTATTGVPAWVRAHASKFFRECGKKGLRRSPWRSGPATSGRRGSIRGSVSSPFAGPKILFGRGGRDSFCTLSLMEHGVLGLVPEIISDFSFWAEEEMSVPVPWCRNHNGP